MDPEGAAVRPTQLLDLPDDVLSRILSQLWTSGGSNWCLRRAPPAFLFGLTCTRLYGLFRRKLHAIDAVHPYAGHRNVPSKNSSDPDTLMLNDMDLGLHLAALTRCAGEHLRILRIPRRVHLNTLLRGLPRYCVNLKELWYSNERSVEWRVEDALYTSMPVLTHVRLEQPRSAFISLGLARCLEELTLTDLSPMSWKAVEKALQTAGKNLQVLRIFFAVKRVHLFKPFSQVATYLRNSLDRDLPALTTLHLAQKPPRQEERDEDESGPHAPVQENWVSFFIGLEEPLSRRIGEARERNSTTETPGLSKIVLTVDPRDAMQCLELFQSFVRCGTEVDLRLAQRRLMWR